MVRIFFITLCLVASILPAIADTPASKCIKFDDVDGAGKCPFNFRIIDDRLLAGGYLFNPIGKGNTMLKVREYIKTLRTLGANSIILLHVPAAGDIFTRQLEMLCRAEKMELIKMRMNSEQVPTEAETATILAKIDDGAYVHCMWGCDRTGAIIAKYLVEKANYNPRQAFEAIIGGGTHSGNKGGFKKVPGNRNLLLYFWPNVSSEAPEVWGEYQEN